MKVQSMTDYLTLSCSSFLKSAEEISLSEFSLLRQRCWRSCERDSNNLTAAESSSSSDSVPPFDASTLALRPSRASRLIVDFWATKSSILV